MVQTDFYTGEPVNSGSPAVFTDPNAMAADMASFGKYDYDPGTRRQIQTAPVPIQNTYGGYYNPYQGGIGAPPPGYTPYGNPQPTYNQYRYGSFGGYYQQPQYYQQYQQPQNQQTTYHIPGINISGEYMPPADFEQQIAQMQMEYFARQQEVEAKQTVDRQGSVYGYGGGYGYNYYGVPYFNPYQYNALNNEYASKIEAMKEQARENRLQFSLNISKLAHKFAGHDIDDNKIREMYTGKTVDIPQAYMMAPEEYAIQQRFANLVPFDNSQAYRDHRAKLQREYNEIIPKDANLKETFDNMGIIAAKWEMEEEMHRRKDGGNLYNNTDNSYKYFVRKKAQERYAKEKGLSMPTGMNLGFNPQATMNSYVSGNPILSQTANLADDGTLNVSLKLPCNVGSHKGETYTVSNSEEAKYDAKREKFHSFVNSIPGTIYLDQQKQSKIERYNYG